MRVENYWFITRFTNSFLDIKLALMVLHTDLVPTMQEMFIQRLWIIWVLVEINSFTGLLWWTHDMPLVTKVFLTNYLENFYCKYCYIFLHAWFSLIMIVFFGSFYNLYLVKYQYICNWLQSFLCPHINKICVVKSIVFLYFFWGAIFRININIFWHNYKLQVEHLCIFCWFINIFRTQCRGCC